MIDVSALNNLDGHLLPAPGNGHTGPLAVTDGTNAKFTVKQVHALHALLSQEVSESMASVAQRAGVSRNTIYRYLKEDAFAAEYRRLTLLEVRGHYAPLMKAIMKGAQERGPGQAALARILLDKIGDPVIDHSENVNRNGEVSIDDLPVPIEVKRHILEVLQACAEGKPLPECCRPHVRLPGTVQAQTPALPPEMKLCTPLDEVELRQHEAPCDS
jgi:AcrR family transcriptional regulator